MLQKMLRKVKKELAKKQKSYGIIFVNRKNDIL